MRTYERSGVTVDQCADCRGIFLDRGELERLVDAEQGWERSHPAAHSREPEQQRSDPRYDDTRRYEGQQKRRKKSFFDELFD
jgi:Zn-finger nucleic acid-binding protein